MGVLDGDPFLHGVAAQAGAFDLVADARVSFSGRSLGGVAGQRSNGKSRLNYLDEEQAWSKGQLISSFAVSTVPLATSEKLLARNPNGPFSTPEEWFFPSTHQGLLEARAEDWLMLQTAKGIVDRPHPLLGVKRWDAGKIIIQRTPKAVHTFSWGAVVMAQCVPWRLDRVVSPDQRSRIGQVLLKGNEEELPLRLDSVQVVDSAEGFVAELTVDHGDEARAKLEFRSKADGTFAMLETLTALRDVKTMRIGTGLIGVLNDPKWVYETHRRRIRFGEQNEVVEALSGKNVTGEGVREIDLDGALRIESAKPLEAQYAGTKKVSRGRATDRLYLNYIDGERSWTKGQVISTYEAVLTPQAEQPAP